MKKKNLTLILEENFKNKTKNYQVIYEISKDENVKKCL